jgi:hypothetical protein
VCTASKDKLRRTSGRAAANTAKWCAGDAHSGRASAGSHRCPTRRRQRSMCEVRDGRQGTLSKAEEKVRVWHEGEGEHKQLTVHKHDVRWPVQHDQPVGSKVLRMRRAFRQRLGRFTPQPAATAAAAARLCSRWMAGEAPRGVIVGCGRGNPRGRVGGAQKHNRRASVADGVHDTNTRTTRARAHTTSEALGGALWMAYWSVGAGRKRGAQRTPPSHAVSKKML